MAKDTGKKLIDMMYGQNPDQAAFGVYPQLKPKRSAQDPQAAKNVPVDLLRGAVSGVLGAPGDIESLIRLLPGLDENTILPTSEDIEKRLPFKSDTPVSRAATGLGQIGGGFYTGPGSPLRLVGAIPGALKHGAQEFAKASAGAAPHVIKPKGGNWLTGNVEGALENLKRGETTPQRIAELEAHLEKIRPKYDLSNPRHVRELADMEGHIKTLKSNLALNNWVESNLTNYVKKEMATPEDPVRKLAEQGIVHREGQQIPAWQYEVARKRSGFPVEGMGQSTAAKDWENLADSSFVIKKAKELADPAFMEDVVPEYRQEFSAKNLSENPWLAKVDPETNIYHVSAYDLGFDHIMDVLREDLASGRIRPEQLNKVSMEQAVRRTYEYDQELAAKMAQARAAQRADLPVYKEYPEGYRWIELNKPGAFASESEAMGHSVRGYEPPQGHPDWIEGSGDRGSLGYGHGGWEGIKSGRAKVYSLVDPKGEPHVTVEVGPASEVNRGFRPNERPPESEYYRLQEEWLEGNKQGTIDPNLTFAEWWRKKEGIPETEIPTTRITQIKGKQNRAPADEYLPFVQDFVRSGQWSDVGDIHNTGMRATRDIFSEAELQKLRDLGHTDLPHIMPGEEIQRYHNMIVPEGQRLKYDAKGNIIGLEGAEGMAYGGRVHISDNPDVMQLELAGGGLVKGLVKAVKGAKSEAQAAEKINRGPAFGAYGYTDDALRRERGSFASNFGVDYGQALTPSFEFVPVSKLKTTEKVADARVNSLMNAMKESGNTLDNKIPPVVVDSNGNVLDGHHRLEAARRLGYEEVPVIEKFDRQVGPKLGEEYAGGGLVKGLIKAVKGTQEVLPAAEREANLAKMLEQSKVKQRMYHSTKNDFNVFDTTREATMGEGSFFGHKPNMKFAEGEGGNVMPVYLSIKNPKVFESILDYDGFNKKELIDQGYDGVILKDNGKLLNAVAFRPEQIKSATGNVGTYDLTNPEINKAGGGLVKGLVKAAQAAKEAPAIIIPSKIQNVREAVRSREGNYAAKRVERAADEVRNLEKMFTEEALKRAFTGDNAKAVVTMSPADFEKYAQALKGRTQADIGPKMAELAKQGEIDKYTVPTDEYIQHLMRVHGGFDQVPYLNLFKDEVGIPSMPEVRGHEGRHRSRALSEAGEPSTLVEISPRGDLREGLPRRSQEEYIEALREELERSGRMVLPEVDGSYRRPAIELPEPYAEGGEVHMAGGGALSKLAKLARAPAKTKQEIEAIAERIAPQVTGEYVRKKPGSAITVADKTKKQFEREKDLPVDIRATTTERVPEPVDIEKLKGDVMIGISGDPTVTGKTLYGVGDVRLGSPSPQHGGPQYGLYHDDSHFWASGEDAAKKVQNLARSASELYESPVVGNYIMMGPESINYAQHFADANLQAIDLSKMSKRQIDEFNKIIREGYNYKKKGEQFQRVFPSFPGIEDKESAYLHMAMDPDLRKHFNAVMQKPTVTEKLNMPSGSDIRFAITEPSLRDLESGVTGYSLGRMRPDIAPEGLKLSEHPTYTHDIPGHFMGTSRYPMPYELTFPDVVKSIRENPKQAPYEFGTVQYGSTVQPIDQQLIDELRMYEERMKALTGKAAGGSVEDLSPSDMLYLQSQPDIGKLSPQEQREYVINIKPDELRQRMQGKYAGGGEITADDLILEERKL